VTGGNTNHYTTTEVDVAWEKSTQRSNNHTPRIASKSGIRSVRMHPTHPSRMCLRSAEPCVRLLGARAPISPGAFWHCCAPRAVLIDCCVFLSACLLRLVHSRQPHRGRSVAMAGQDLFMLGRSPAWSFDLACAVAGAAVLCVLPCVGGMAGLCWAAGCLESHPRVRASTRSFDWSSPRCMDTPHLYCLVGKSVIIRYSLVG